MRSKSSFLRWFAGVALTIVASLFILSFFLDSIIRARIEHSMNAKLRGYHTALAGAHLQLLDGTLTLNELIVIQNAHPAPPVADIHALRVGIEWHELLFGSVVADALVTRPRLHIDLIQLRAERANKVPLRKEGWQQAVEGIYPFRLNRLRIIDGSAVYVDADPKRPLELTDLRLTALNIRNIQAPKNPYPSPIQANAAVNGTGRVTIDGNANFLSQPTPGLRVRYWAERLSLAPFEPEAGKANVNLKGGVMQGDGALEYAPGIARLELYDASIDGLKLEYVHTAATAEAERRRVQEVKAGVHKVNNRRGLLLKIDDLRLTNSDLGFNNTARPPSYALYFSAVSASLRNLSNHFSEGNATLAAQGLFMADGPASIDATFRPEINGPDFTLYLAIQKTDLTRLNPLLTAYGRFDVAAGTFMLFTQMSVKDGAIKGYVKPMFGNMEVYSLKKDSGKPLLHQAYEVAIGTASKLLTNHSTEKVATEVNISGSLQRPNMSTWQALGELIHNAFVSAILPGFDREAARARQPGG